MGVAAQPAPATLPLVERSNEFSVRMGAAILDKLGDLFPGPAAAREERIGARPGTPEWGRAYARDQFMHKIRHGSLLAGAQPPLIGRDVLEIGCGHGGITCYFASVGARRAVGIDLELTHVEYGRELAQELGAAGGRSLPVAFLEMDAASMSFADSTFDVVVAENAFEHFADPAAVMGESFRVLRPGGMLLVPVFSSLKSKYGLHLKRGLRVPWANIVFREPAIVEAVRRRAARDPSLGATYPGLARGARTVRDLRRHRDLNDITYSRFRHLAQACGFVVESFRVHHTVIGRVAERLVRGPLPGELDDVLSTGAGAVLRKPTSVHTG